MKSTAQVGGHPIHPMLIPYPFALLTSAVAFDVAARVTGRWHWAATARNLSTAGLGSALVAAVPGAIDYFFTVPSGTGTKRDATKHALLNLSGLTCFALSRSLRKPDAYLPKRGLVCGLIGTGLLACAAWIGGEMVYHHRVAVEEEHEKQRLPQPRPELASSRPSSLVGGHR